eukprot:m.1023924 g.1023924  ORF g.1023924 m.1023924 type:complete len:78 (-) comp24098_c0_seq53:1405-1638(-)
MILSLMRQFQRDGARFSNAGSGNCQGSGDDTIYWAWDDDDHGCNRALRIGTGCDFRAGISGNPAGLPSFRYNFLFVY